MKISQRDVAAMDDLDNALDSESGYTGARRIVIFSLLIGAFLLMTALALSFQTYFEAQVEAAKQISQ